MRKLYYKLVSLIGYTFLLEDRYNPETFELDKKYSSLSLYKFIGNYKHDGSLRMIRIWQIKIR